MNDLIRVVQGACGPLPCLLALVPVYVVYAIALYRNRKEK